MLVVTCQIISSLTPSFASLTHNQMVFGLSRLLRRYIDTKLHPPCAVLLMQTAYCPYNDTNSRSRLSTRDYSRMKPRRQRYIHVDASGISRLGESILCPFHYIKCVLCNRQCYLDSFIEQAVCKYLQRSTRQLSDHLHSNSDVIVILAYIPGFSILSPHEASLVVCICQQGDDAYC